MFTVCPKCALTLVVTAADLKVAQGYVRCGRCSNVFNAISALSDEIQAPPGLEGYIQPEPPREPQSEMPPGQSAEQPAEQAGEVASEAESSATLTAAEPEEKLEFDPASTNVSDVFVEPRIGDNEATGTFEAIVLESGETDSSEPAKDEVAPAPADRELDSELQALAAQIQAAGSPDTRAPSAETSALGASGVDGLSDARPQRSRWLQVGVGVLSVLLVLQALHHHRQDLAAVPRLHGPVTALYRAIGSSVTPRWDLSAYEVRQLGGSASATTTGQLIVRASVKNNATRPHPLPLLRVTIQDRFGNKIAARDVPPSSYTPRSTRGHALLGAGQRIDAEIAFVDPGSEAVGFEIDACLASPQGAVNCANH